MMCRLAFKLKMAGEQPGKKGLNPLSPKRVNLKVLILHRSRTTTLAKGHMLIISNFNPPSESAGLNSKFDFVMNSHQM